MKLNKVVDIEPRVILKRPIIGLFCVLAMIMIYSCSDSGSKIIGAWSKYSQYEYGGERCEFFKDGSCYFETGYRREAGRWTALEDGRIKVEVTKSGLFGKTSVMTLFAFVTGDEFVLDSGGNNRESYVRDSTQRATEIQYENYTKAMNIKVNDAEAYNNLAWLLATCKDAKYHDGKRAVELALKAVKIAKTNYTLDTLSAAYARNGQFKKAVTTQQRALSNGQIEGGEARLELYRQKRPYQEK